MKKTTKSKSRKQTCLSAVVGIHSSFNNTRAFLTNLQGDLLAWSSGGCVGFKGPKKSTPHAAQLVMEDLIKKAEEFGVKSVEVCVSGGGSGREAALRALKGDFDVTVVRDVTPVPHNGPRLRKRRRA